MAKLSYKNIKHGSPAWMVNLTGILAILTPILPGMINTMPTGVSQEVRAWLLWVMTCITGTVGAITMFSKTKSPASPETEEDQKPTEK